MTLGLKGAYCILAKAPTCRNQNTLPVTVGTPISELRIDSGPGYHIYFRKQGDTIIVLL